MQLFVDSKLAAIGFKFGLAALFAATAIGCGSASNNDQGVSFTNLGFFAPDEEGVCQPDVGLTGLAINFSSQSEPGFGSEFGGACVGVANNMISQSVRTQRIRTDYIINGASENPPSTLQAFTAFLNPVEVSSTPSVATGGGETAGSGATAQGLGSFVVGGFVAVPAEVRSWMILNRAKLPELPFTMTITTTIFGITSAGDQLETNPAVYLLRF